MSLSNKELLDKIKDEVWNHAYPFGNGEWKSGRNDDLWPIVCERFATEKAKELLPKEKKENKICIASHGPVSAQAESDYQQFEGKNLHIVTPESSEPQEKGRNEFEKYPALAEHLERMAATGQTGNFYDWNNFLQELNKTLKSLA